MYKRYTALEDSATDSLYLFGARRFPMLPDTTCLIPPHTNDFSANLRFSDKNWN